MIQTLFNSIVLMTLSYFFIFRYLTLIRKNTFIFHKKICVSILLLIQGVQFIMAQMDKLLFITQIREEHALWMI
jgi:uncharacterized membrane protein YjjP (DUF1212 family)